jgi:hypothetical protein
MSAVDATSVDAPSNKDSINATKAKDHIIVGFNV